MRRRRIWTCSYFFLCSSQLVLVWITVPGPIHGEGLGSTPERWRKLLLERSTWPAVEAYFANSDLIVLGFGSTENHGRHNPLGTDWMAPQRILDLMDERRPEVLYGPTLRLGSADHFIDYPGTLSLGDDLLYQVASRICGQLYHYGARHFCFVNGHGGNTRALTMTGYELNDRGCQVALLNWWKLAGELNPAWGGGHGGAQETSADLWIDPDSVDMAALGPMDLVDDGGSNIKTQGFDVVEFEGVHPSLIRRARRYATNGWIGKDDPGRHLPSGESRCSPPLRTGQSSLWTVLLSPRFLPRWIARQEGRGISFRLLNSCRRLVLRSCFYT